MRARRARAAAIPGCGAGRRRSRSSGAPGRRAVRIGRAGRGWGAGRTTAPADSIEEQGYPTGGRTMTKAELVEEVSTATGVSKNHTAVIVDHLLEAICRALSEGKHLEIRGFGTFKVRERRARRARNPRSGSEVLVPAKLVPVFKPSKELKAQVLQPDSTAVATAAS